MEEMRWVIVVVLLALAAPAEAQQPAQWVRLSLNDGRFVDGYITGGDAAAYFVQTSYGYFSIMRTNVVAVTPMGAPAPSPAAAPTPTPSGNYAPPPTPSGNYAPPPSGNYAPMPAPMTQPLAPPTDERKEMGGRAAGAYFFALSYGITILAASAKVDDDKSARAGYIPVVGPIMWAFGDDEDDIGEDGWDWLAAGGTLIQGMGAYLLITGGNVKSTKVKVTAVTTKHYGGLVVGGSF